jgi:hypothetical protein
MRWLLRNLLKGKQPKYKSVVTPEHVTTLWQMQSQARRYNQRCVEALAFIPSGGQQWTRSLQIRIPRLTAPAETSWRIISLGVFNRSRFPDFQVYDATGRRLNLLTRQQHGTVLTRSFIAKYFRPFPEKIAELQNQRAPDKTAQLAYNEMYAALYLLFTTVDNLDKKAERVSLTIIQAAANLLRYFGRSPQNSDAELKALGTDIGQIWKVTEYLCWTEAEADEVVNLRVTHTSRDAQHDLAPLRSFEEAFGSMWKGVAEPRATRWAVHDDWYMQYGLAPVKYSFEVPSYDYANSYYFTIAPPAQSDVTYLDWETGYAFSDGDSELDSAPTAMHLHNGQVDSEQTASKRTIRAYVRCAPNEHKKMSAGALLNGVFAFLVAYGSLRGTTTQEWLLVTPTVLLAYLAQQQRHYYAHTTRRQRAVVWVYLALSVLFLVTIAFNKAHLPAGSEGWGWFTFVMAAFFALSSAGVFALYAPLGYSFQRITERRTRDRVPTAFDSEGNKIPPWKIYEGIIHRYCAGVMKFISVVVVVTACVIGLTWRLPRGASTPQHPAPAPAPSPAPAHPTPAGRAP